MNDTEPGSTQKRRHQREDVQLEVLVKLGAHQAWQTRTRNMSEGGIALQGVAGMDVAAGIEVGVSLEGIISDNSSHGHGGYAMRIVHSSDDETGLEFI